MSIIDTIVLGVIICLFVVFIGVVGIICLPSNMMHHGDEEEYSEDDYFDFP